MKNSIFVIDYDENDTNPIKDMLDIIYHVYSVEKGRDVNSSLISVHTDLLAIVLLFRKMNTEINNLLEEIKNNEILQTIPTIAVMHAVNEEQKEKLYLLGVLQVIDIKSADKFLPSILDNCIRIRKAVMHTYMRSELNDDYYESLEGLMSALHKQQFEVWYQPQYNYSTGALVGTEALVRWRHPVKGLVLPNDFIPFFENNGFVYELDKYVWEQACSLLQEMKKTGRPIVPVSVNLSLCDVFHEDMTDYLYELIEKYQIPVEALHLELKESVFFESRSRLIQTVKELKKLGFTIVIDNFGSGYSSLNTLKDIPANILKLDMKFLTEEENADRGGNIAASIIRMAKWIEMTVIAEGVDKATQADFLYSVGCTYMQGFLYSGPMSKEDYLKAVDEIVFEKKPETMESIDTYDSHAFWNPDSLDTLVFSHFSGGAFVYEYNNGQCEILRVNSEFAKTFHCELSGQEILKLNPLAGLSEKDKKASIDTMERARHSNKAESCEIYTTSYSGNESGEYVRFFIRRIASCDNRILFYGYVENITAQKIAEKERKVLTEQLQAIMNNINGGFTTTVVENGIPVLISANEQFYRLLGYTKEEYMREIRNPHDMVYAEDRDMVAEVTQAASEYKTPFTLTYRVVKKDMKIRWWQSNISIIELPGVDKPVQIAIVYDITEQRQLEQKERKASDQLQSIMANVNCGITAIAMTKPHPEFLFANDRYFEILGYSRETYMAEVKDPDAVFYPDDREEVRRLTRKVLQKHEPVTMKYRILQPDGEIRWVKAEMNMARFSGMSEPVMLAISTDITSERDSHSQLYFLNDVARVLLSQPDFRIGIQCVLAKLLEYFDGEWSNIFEFDYERQISRITYEINANYRTELKTNVNEIPFEKTPFWFDYFSSAEYYLLEDVNKLLDDVGEKQILINKGIYSLFAIPMYQNKKLSGFVCVYNMKRNKRHVERLITVGNYIASMLTKRDLDAKLYDESQAMIAIMNGIPGGFSRLQVMEDGTIQPLYFSDSFLNMIDMKREEMTELMNSMDAQHAITGIHHEDKGNVHKAIEEMITDGEAHSARFRLRNRDGGYIWLTLVGKLRVSHKGERYLNIYYMDEQLQIALDEARRESKQKSKFLSQISHDIRTPLNSILNFSRFIEETDSLDEAKQMSRSILKSGEFLQILINDTLDMNRIEAGSVELKLEPCSYAEFEISVRTVLSDRALQKGISLQFIRPSQKSKCVMLDKLRVQQIVLNLIGNAIKYTDKGGVISVKTDLLEQTNFSELVRCSVTDTGIGMSKEFQEHVFEPFRQERRNMDVEAGSGLGLSIVKELVELMNGTIYCESELGEGTTFTFEIPAKVAPVQGTDSPEKLAEYHEDDFKGIRVLLCEDHPINQVVAVRYLEKAGCIVETADNGAEGVKKFHDSRTNEFALIIMDLRMPEMDGYEATEKIRAMDRVDAKTVPIIAMTADAFEDDIQKCMEVGINKHLAKPIDPKTFYGTLAQYIQKEEKE